MEYKLNQQWFAGWMNVHHRYEVVREMTVTL
jgi:hypothetical protein